jgi:hypothetical protein
MGSLQQESQFETRAIIISTYSPEELLRPIQVGIQDRSMKMGLEAGHSLMSVLRGEVLFL